MKICLLIHWNIMGFATIDNLSIGAIHQLKSMSILVPKEAKVVGFDDANISKFIYPSITNIKQDTKLLGKNAASSLIKLNEEDKFIKFNITIPMELIANESTRGYYEFNSTNE